MRAVSAGFAAAVRSSHRRVARVALLDSSLVAQSYLAGVVDGSVTIASDRRRSCSLSIADTDGTLAPSTSADPLYPNRLIRVDRGVVVGGAEEWVSLGVFAIDRPSVTVGPAATSLGIQAQDRLKFALKSSFTVPTRYDAGIAIGTVIAAIAADAGMGSFNRFDDGGKSLAADRAFETGDNRVDAMRAISHDYGLDLYVDADGYLVMTAELTIATLPDTSFVFERGADAVMLGVTKDLNDDRLYNHVLVVGEASDMVPINAEARDLNPDSPAYDPTDGSGPIGDRLYTYSSAMIRNIDQAQEVANALLLSVALIEESISVQSMVNPALEVGDVIGVIEARSRTNDLYLIDGLTIPLDKGAMGLTSKKVRPLA